MKVRVPSHRGAANPGMTDAQRGEIERAFEQLDPQKQLPLAGLLFVGTGSPNGVVSAQSGRLYLNLAGGAATTLYVKESGTGNTGWVAK